MSQPERYGLAPYKTRNFYLNTTDGESAIGVWHILPHSVYREAAAHGAGSITSANRQLFAPLAPLGKDVFEESFKKRDTVIYFHGNAVLPDSKACNRAISYRVGTYKALSTKLDVNVIAIDYRGYGDSTGSPSEDGLLSDATTVWDYISVHSRKDIDGETDREEGKSIVVMGHSLGTAKTKAPVLIIHAKDDHDIPASHSKRLYEMLSKSRSPEGAAPRTRVVKREGWGSVMMHVPEETRRGDGGSSDIGGGVAWFEADHGAHNRVGGGEGVIQLMQAFLQSETPSDLAYNILGDI
ncbi:hypothetical protein QFC21_004309 [Naganishia friedmannii]|uniref:Uncharacterized protein n=1 Tax=Naganishia friedmannii TaxID=89922 RepID=A0ACC2VHT1_9TREE|nr:hypothetical protein QFC21_004309 [Naganishia friedmannii]